MRSKVFKHVKNGEAEITWTTYEQIKDEYEEVVYGVGGKVIAHDNNCLCFKSTSGVYNIIPLSNLISIVYERTLI